MLGSIIGDIVGGIYEFSNIENKGFSILWQGKRIYRRQCP